MLPLLPCSTLTRTPTFVQEEWDTYFSNGRAEKVVGAGRDLDGELCDCESEGGRGASFASGLLMRVGLMAGRVGRGTCFAAGQSSLPTLSVCFCRLGLKGDMADEIGLGGAPKTPLFLLARLSRQNIPSLSTTYPNIIPFTKRRIKTRALNGRVNFFHIYISCTGIRVGFSWSIWAALAAFTAWIYSRILY